ncbi:pyroglutamyl-peptidase I [Rhodopirellula sp. MGV]|uniref:pyroglutamyl-peptidase I n=1 Tax=Rhodopirellula sp. MGV TaxID=2023130 RepID=UPI000B96D151|nr:pyroglutamyl-peptidase I [Rhodopirellula sp. MGV]OYP34052.1 pyrrolidone-carboxylate peptidase [Rhodopirellula sp. MGV]PNY38319.1 pyrrolidone-carboxylate peptidase [Rhodopirellula baltica]
MTRILLTAFEPYDRWKENASWLALVDFTSWYEGEHDITTRRYPVDYQKLKGLLREDIADDFDFAIHLGQAPGSTLILLEAVGLNLRNNGEPLLVDAPAAYRSNLDLIRGQERLTAAGIPSVVSHHAGTYLCNAALYLSLHYSHEMGRRTESVFVHLPLTPAQVASDGSNLASMSTPMQSAAIALLIDELTN